MRVSAGSQGGFVGDDDRSDREGGRGSGAATRGARPDSDRPLRIAIVAPVAQATPPRRTGSVETVTALLANGLVAAGHDVTLFATGDSRTAAKLHATFERGYHEDPDLWPWELCELLNLAAAVERGGDFDVIHYQAEYAPLSLAFARLSRAPLVVTVHHAPAAAEVDLWSRITGARFIAISAVQRRLLDGLDAVATIHHAVDVHALAPQEGSARRDGASEGGPETVPTPAAYGDYVLFLGRFTEGKGALQAIEVARHAGVRLVLAAAENEHYRTVLAPHVDGERVVYAGEVAGTDKAALLAGARALLYPVQSGEPFGLVLAEAAACGTPVAALRRGAVEELIDDGVTGGVFDTLDAMVEGLPRVLALDRARVRTRAMERFAPERMVAAHVGAYHAVIESTRGVRA